MYNFSIKSKEKLELTHPSLVKICNEAIKYFDFTIKSSLRTSEEQHKLYLEGFTTLDGIHNKSKHQANQDGFATAIDIHPYPIDFNNLNRYYFLAGLFLGIATKFDIAIRWGGDWNMNGVFKDNKFNDLGHFELINY